MAKRIKISIACLATGVAILSVIIVLKERNSNQPPTYQFLAGTLPERHNETNEKYSLGVVRRKFYYYSINGNYDEICSRANQELTRLGFSVSPSQGRKYRQIYSDYIRKKRHTVTILDQAWLNAVNGRGPIADANGVGVVKISIATEENRYSWVRRLKSRFVMLRWRLEYKYPPRRKPLPTSSKSAKESDGTRRRYLEEYTAVYFLGTT